MKYFKNQVIMKNGDILRRILISFLTVSLCLTTVHGQVWKTPCFDSTKHFVKGIYFLLKDSTGKKESVFREIKYIKETTTRWDLSKKKWETVSFFKNSIEPFHPLENVTKIDTIFFDDKYSIEACLLCLFCSGPYKEIAGWDMIKEELRHPDGFCMYYFQMTIINPKGQKQELYFQIL
jgi:hypothetical protein